MSQPAVVRATAPAKPIRSRWHKLSAPASALVSLFVLAFATYCLMFPVWVYGLFFDRTSDVGFFSYGVGAPFRDYPIPSFLLVVASLTFILGVMFVPKLLSFFSRRLTPLVAIAIAIIIVCCVGVYTFGSGMYQEAVVLRKDATQQRAIADAMRHVGAASLQGKAPDVAYYAYLDKDQVSSLYAQIEPEWLDKQLTVTESSSASGKMGVDGPVNGEIGATGTQQTETVKEAATATPEKKCKAVMQYASEKKGARAYSVFADWQIFNLLQVVEEHDAKPKPEPDFGDKLPLNRTEMQELRASSSYKIDFSPEMRQEINDDLKQRNWNAMASGELTNLSDFVFVTGDFRVSPTPTLLLVHDFVPPDGSISLSGIRFSPVQFDVTFPSGSTGLDLRAGSQKLGVFGKVVHGLDQQGTIAIRAIAVWFPRS